MDAEAKKAKYDRATHEQLQYYVKYCRDRPEFLSGKNQPKAPKQMQECWTELAEGLNALRGPTRNVSKWKDTLGVWKSQLRTRARRIKSSQKVTGGGPCLKPLTDFEELAVSTFGAAAVSGIERPTLGLMLPPENYAEPLPDECSLQEYNASSQTDIEQQNINSLHECIPPSTIPSISPVSIPESETQRPKGAKLVDMVWEKIGKKEEEEKGRVERERQMMSILTNLTSCVSDLVNEVKNLKSEK